MWISALIALAVLLITAIGLLGWFAKRQDWTVTTGWQSLPAELRPDSQEPLADEPWIRWLGHSGFVIRWHGETLLLDPNLSGHCTVSKRIMNLPPALDALGPVHALISHAHFDHLNQQTLVDLPHLSTILLPAGSEVFLNRINANTTRIVPITQGASYVLGDLVITPVAAAHNGNRFHPLQSRFEAVGYMIRSPQGTTLYYAGDTAYANPWSNLREQYHPDIAILPIGAHAPRIPLKFHHLNPEEAVRAASELGVRKVIPCHFGTFTLSLDRPNAALPRFARAIRQTSLTWQMPVFLQPHDLNQPPSRIVRDNTRPSDHET